VNAPLKKPPNSGLFALYVLVSVLLPLSGARAAGPDYRLEQAGNGVWAAIVNDEGLAGGNAGFIIGDESVAVIDTFQDFRPAQALLAPKSPHSRS
jgi:hypothetical protein